MDEYKALQDINKGRQAGELLDNPLFIEAFNTIETEVTEIWKTTKTNQAELREESFHSLRALQRVRGILQMWKDDAKIAQEEMNRLEKKSEAKSRKLPWKISQLR